MKKNTLIDISAAKMLEEIRKILNLNIEDFVYQMSWPNTKYYAYVKNGRKRNGQTSRIKSIPTINKVFVGINQAIKTYPHWNAKKVEITYIVIKHIMPTTKLIKQQ